MIRTILIISLLIPILAQAHPPDRRAHRHTDKELQSELAKLIADVAVIEGQVQALRGDRHARRRIKQRLATLRANLGTLLASLSGPPVVEEPPPPVAMEAGAFSRVLKAVEGESFAKDKLGVLRTVAPDNWFTVGQVARVLGQFSFAKDKLSAVEMMAPRIVDPENRFELYEQFTFSKDKDALRKILR